MDADQSVPTDNSDVLRKFVRVSEVVLQLQEIRLDIFDKRGQRKAEFLLDRVRLSAVKFYQHTEVITSLRGLSLKHIKKEHAPIVLISTDYFAPASSAVSVRSQRSDSDVSSTSDSQSETNAEDIEFRRQAFPPDSTSSSDSDPVIPIDYLHEHERFMTHARGHRPWSTHSSRAPFLDVWFAATPCNPSGNDFDRQNHCVVRTNCLEIHLGDDTVFELLDEFAQDYWSEAMKRPDSSPDLLQLESDSGVTEADDTRTPMRIAVHLWAVRVDISRQKARRILVDLNSMDAVVYTRPEIIQGKIFFDHVAMVDPDAPEPFRKYLAVTSANIPNTLVFTVLDKPALDPRTSKPKPALSLNVLLQGVRVVFTMRFLDSFMEFREEMTEMKSARTWKRKIESSLKKRLQSFRQYFEERLQNIRSESQGDADVIGIPIRIALADVQIMFPGMQPYQQEIILLRDIEQLVTTYRERKRQAEMTDPDFNVKDIEVPQLADTVPLSQLTKATCLVARAPLVVCQTAPVDLDFTLGTVGLCFEDPIGEDEPIDGNSLLLLCHQLDLALVDVGPISADVSRRHQEPVLAPANVAIRIKMNFSEFEHRKMDIDILLTQACLSFSEASFAAVANLLDEFSYGAVIRKYTRKCLLSQMLWFTINCGKPRCERISQEDRTILGRAPDDVLNHNEYDSGHLRTADSPV